MMKLYAIGGDPGHGGADSGATGNGMLEKNLNWNIALDVKIGCDLHGIPFKILREKDECPSLAERAERARQWGADLVISIHHNAGGGTGYEIYKSVKGSLDDTFADLLAAEYRASGENAHGVGVKITLLPDNSDYYGILRETAARGIPAIISEYAFIDSADAQRIDTYTEQKQNEAKAIVRALCRLCGVKFIEY